MLARLLGFSQLQLQPWKINITVFFGRFACMKELLEDIGTA